MSYTLDRDYLNLDFQKIIPGDLNKSYAVFRLYVENKAIEDDSFIFRVVDPNKVTATGFDMYYPATDSSSYVPNGFEYDEVNAEWFQKTVIDKAENSHLVANGPLPFLMTYTSVRKGELNWIDVMILFPYGIDVEALLPIYTIHLIDINDMDITVPLSPIPNDPAEIEFSICQDVTTVDLVPYRAAMRSEVVNTPLRQLWQLSNYLDCKLTGFTDQTNLDLGVIATFCGTDSIIQDNYTTIDESLSIELIATSPNAVIFYTIDPNGSPTIPYTGCVDISAFEQETFYIKYQAKLDSLGVMSQVYTLKVTLAPQRVYITPLPVAGTYLASQTVTLKSNLPNTRIYYTLDGSDPIWTSDGSVANSTILYADETNSEGTGPFSVTSDTVVKYKGYLPVGGSVSPGGEVAYVIDLTALVVTLTPPSGTYPVDVDIDVTQSGLAIGSNLEVSYNDGPWTSIGAAPQTVSIDGSLGDTTKLDVRTTYSGKTGTATGQYELTSAAQMEVDICGPSFAAEGAKQRYNFIVYLKQPDGTRIDVTNTDNYQISWITNYDGTTTDPDFIGSGTLINTGVTAPAKELTPGIDVGDPITSDPVTTADTFVVKVIAKDLSGDAQNSGVFSKTVTYVADEFKEEVGNSSITVASVAYNYSAIDNSNDFKATVQLADSGATPIRGKYSFTVFAPSTSSESPAANPITPLRVWDKDDVAHANWRTVVDTGTGQTHYTYESPDTDPLDLGDAPFNLLARYPWVMVAVVAVDFTGGVEVPANASNIVFTASAVEVGVDWAAFPCIKRSFDGAATGNCYDFMKNQKMYVHGSDLTHTPTTGELDLFRGNSALIAGFEYDYRILVDPATVRDYTTNEPWVLMTSLGVGADYYEKLLDAGVGNNSIVEWQVRLIWCNEEIFMSHIQHLNDADYEFQYTPNIDDGPFPDIQTNITEISGPATYGGFGVNTYYKKSSGDAWTAVTSPISGLSVDASSPSFYVKADALDADENVLGCPATSKIVTFAFNVDAGFTVNPPGNGEVEIGAPVIDGASQIFTSATGSGEIWYLTSSQGTEVKSGLFNAIIKLLIDGAVPMPDGVAFSTWELFYADYIERGDLSGILIAVNAMPNAMVVSSFTQDISGSSVTLFGASGGALEAVWVNIEGASTKYGVRYRNPVSSLINSTNLGLNVYSGNVLNHSSEWNTVPIPQGAWDESLTEFPCWSIRRRLVSFDGCSEALYSLTDDDGGSGGGISQFQFAVTSATAFKHNGSIQVESQAYPLTKTTSVYQNQVGMSLQAGTFPFAIRTDRMVPYQNGYAYFDYIKFTEGSSLPSTFTDDLRIRFELINGNFSPWYTFSIFVPSSDNSAKYADAVTKWSLIPFSEYEAGTKEKDRTCFDFLGQGPSCGGTLFYNEKTGKVECLPYTVATEDPIEAT